MKSAAVSSGGRDERNAIESGVSAYEPTSRRPIAQIFRRTAETAARLCVRGGIHPDAISYSSIVVSLGAALCFWQSGRNAGLLLVAPGLCYARLWLNMLDGMVALAAGKASRRGEILNDLPDRISDVIIFAGAAQSGWMNPIIGYWTAIFALLTAYVGISGQAIGGRREFGGVMSKPWRMVLLHIGAWLVFFTRNGALLDWTCLAIIAGCAQTIAVRLRRILASA